MKYLAIIVLFVLSLSSLAQQGLVMDFGEIDSTELQVQKNIEYQNFINGSLAEQLMMEDLRLPPWDLMNNFKTNFSLDLNSFRQVQPLSGYLNLFTSSSPYFFNNEIFSEAAYKVSDKFVFGGFSHGTKVPLVAPPMPANSYFNTHGSTMFMQYKVSKNFKIETSVSVGNNGLHGF